MPRIRGSKLPDERAWQRSALLAPVPVGRVPDLISDGGGLPFPPAALEGPYAELDPADPAVGALAAELSGTTPRLSLRRPWRGAPETVPASPVQELSDWRLLARAEDEALFGRGLPPRLLTACLRRTGRRGRWSCVAQSAARPLRATRDGIRASSWRLDPSQEVGPEDTVLRILVTEQTFAGGSRADGRVLAPDLHVNADELVLTMFVTPQPGFQMRVPNPETAVRVSLPGPVGSRRIIDGALYEAT